MRRCLLLAFACLAGPSFAQVVASSTFDWELEGWTGDTCQGGFSWQLDGGNPGGHLQWREPCGSLYARAPEAFTGNWTTLNGTGRLSFDYKVANRPANGDPLPYEVRLTSGFGDILVWRAQSPGTTTDWVHFDVPIVESAWEPVVGSWSQAMSNVRFLDIRIRMFTNTDASQVNKIDNVVLSVPEPSALVGLGVGGLFLIRRRRTV
ncbi:MAG TPA: PEP-CTERM sorting domain-containing protein [Fimbriimonadaceae bacterium]|nr:PEP-CTERM sorting domain-containing protein [Fimbriimonadaceae bacterium]